MAEYSTEGLTEGLEIISKKARKVSRMHWKERKGHSALRDKKVINLVVTNREYWRLNQVADHYDTNINDLIRVGMKNLFIQIAKISED